ncbi:type II secretion system minor pseudopilin GspK [Duganella sp. LX20W]|uniref:Type II secretion system protein K n=2 Tax=Rugamonas brunnea TaxID=2758569 RepID=A0A7W2IBD9_9BURK|nr:type II secretion system minor pseudopilin GspK [Rugamonas brunnea]
MARSPRSPRPPRTLLRQRGVAVVTALLLTTLAVTIVASLFWQQQVQVRSMENQRLQLQTRWILRGALDWARLILRQDGMDRGRVTTLDGVWATPLAETRLDQYVERERVEGENFNATLSGQMTDAQSRYNLANLAVSRAPVAEQVAVFQRLLTVLQLDGSLAQAVADEVARAQQPAAQGQAASNALPVRAGTEPMEMMRAEDLLAVAGFTPQAIERLRDFVIVLPAQTAINVNTAPVELLAALPENFSMAEAAALAYHRKQAYFNDVGTYKSQLNGKQVSSKVNIDIRSDYFLVLSKVRLDRANLDAQALIQRESSGNYKTDLVWIRQN